MNETWKSIYDSGYHHPLVAYLVGLAFVLVLARRLPFLYGYLVVFTVEILADATATGAWSSVPLGTPAYTFWSVLFIVLGDFRYFFLAERMIDLDEPITRALVVAACTSLVVPLVTGILQRAMGLDTRELYMIYEAPMAVIVLALDRFRFQKRIADPEVRVFVHRVSVLFATLYAGWAACDLLLYTGFPIGHVLRVIPNVLYYGAFIPFVYYAAPDSMKSLAPKASVA